MRISKSHWRRGEKCMKQVCQSGEVPFTLRGLFFFVNMSLCTDTGDITQRAPPTR